MSLKLFLKSKIFLINLGIAVVLLLLLIWGFFRILDIYTHHDESLTVPDMTGKPVEEVEEIIKDRNLRMEISDTAYHPGLPPGSVIEHNPPPYTQVKRGRRVYLTLNSSTPPKVSVPSLEDVSLRQALLILNSRRLKAGDLIYEPDIAQNVVLKMQLDGKTIAAGDTVPQGTRIDLVLGDGLAGSKVDIPNLRGLTLEEAMFVLNVSGLNLGSAVYEGNITDSTEAKIYRQMPLHSDDDESKIAHGEAINVFLISPEAYEIRKQESIQPWEEHDPDEIERPDNLELYDF